MITGIVAITEMKLPSSVKSSRRGGRRARSSIPNLPRGGWVLDKPPNHFSWGVYKNYFCISDIHGRRGAGREGRGCLLVLAGRLCTAVGQLMGGGHRRLAPEEVYCCERRGVGGKWRTWLVADRDVEVIMVRTGCTSSQPLVWGGLHSNGPWKRWNRWVGENILFASHTGKEVDGEEEN